MATHSPARMPLFPRRPGVLTWCLVQVYIHTITSNDPQGKLRGTFCELFTMPILSPGYRSLSFISSCLVLPPVSLPTLISSRPPPPLAAAPQNHFGILVLGNGGLGLCPPSPPSPSSPATPRLNRRVQTLLRLARSSAYNHIHLTKYQLTIIAYLPPIHATQLRREGEETHAL